MGGFVKPDFARGELEFRFENGEVCIYGTARGLQKLAEQCLQLIKGPAQQHIHLETTGLLTRQSAKTSIAIFDK